MCLSAKLPSFIYQLPTALKISPGGRERIDRTPEDTASMRGEVVNSNVELKRHHLGSTILVCRLDAGDF